MMRWRRIFTRGVSGTIGLARCAAAPGAGFRVLMYHAVGSAAADDALGIYSIAPDLFAQQIAALADYDSASIVGLEEGLSATEPLRVAVTFDDGYRDNLYRAAPALQKHGIPFTVFVCTGFMRQDSGNYLTPGELRELAALPGVTIGSHGATHTPLTGLDARALHDELATSKAYLEDVMGRTVTVLSYPHGAVDRRVRDAAAAAGYTIGACSRFGSNGPARDPLLLCRTDVLGIDSVRVFKQKLHGDWDWYRWRSADPAAS